MTDTPNRLSYALIARKSLPIILANASVPLLGLVDTALMGHVGSPSDLAALAICTLIFNFIFWAFGFLRMGTTSLVARAEGARSPHEESVSLKRQLAQSLVLAWLIAAGLLVLQFIIWWAASGILGPPPEVSVSAGDYFFIRMWSAPATLTVYVINGVFIGLGFMRAVLAVQLVLNIGNAVFDYLFASHWSFGIQGIAIGTVLAEYLAASLAVFILATKHYWPSLQDFRFENIRASFAQILSQNSDIFIRTLLLLVAFAYFTRRGAAYGELVLAANYLLLQYISFSAFFLDGYAQVLEMFCGRAVGAKDANAFVTALRRASVLALTTALVLAGLFLLFFDSTVALLTDMPEVQLHAAEFRYWVFAYIILSVAAFQLDGVFIGAGFHRALRHSYIVAVGGFIVLAEAFVYLGRQQPAFASPDYLWCALLALIIFRGLTMSAFLPKLYREAFFSRID